MPKHYGNKKRKKKMGGGYNDSMKRTPRGHGSGRMMYGHGGEAMKKATPC